jgi:hypothetical protein
VEGRRPEGPDADWVHLPDPIADALKALAARIEALERAVGTLAGQTGTGDGELGRGDRPFGDRSSARQGAGAAAPSTLGPDPAGG